MKRAIIALIILFITRLVFCAASLAAQKPEGVVLEETEITVDIATGGTYTVSAHVTPEDADQSLHWFSSNYSLFTINNEGQIQAYKTGVGFASVNVPYQAALNAQCRVRVIDSRIPEKISIAPGTLSLEPTTEAQLIATVAPDTADQTLIWKSSNQSVAAVDENGSIVCKNEGTCYIRAISARDSGVYGQIALTVKYLAAPSSILAQAEFSEMEIGQTQALSYTISPSSASQIVRFHSSDAEVATVDENGVVTAVGYGECEINVVCARDARVFAAVAIQVNDARVPDRIVAYPSPLRMEPSQTRKIDILMFPQDKTLSLVWNSVDPSIATVNEEGAITALREGQTVVYAYSAYTKKRFARIPVSIAYGANVQKIELAMSEMTLHQGDTTPLSYALTPENASRALVSESTDPSVAYVDEYGQLVAAKYGETDITVYFHKNRAVSAGMHVTVEDERYPLTMETQADTNPLLQKGEVLSAAFAFTPDRADTRYHWESANESIVKIGEDGLPVAVGCGVTAVTAVCDYREDLKTEFSVTVPSPEYSLIMPARRTDVSGIEENLEKIENVRASAERTLQALYEAGNIPQNEYEKRLTVVNAAFKMYGFAWMVKKEQRYWKAENSEEGAKDFQPGVVYYGLPYTSGVNSHRTYDFKRALDAGRYLPVAGEAYYILNQENPEFQGSYVGNDCSSFVALALFGYTSYGGDTVKTGTLYYDDRLRAETDTSSLRAGDILVCHSEHVVMFLYWADEAHTQAVFIEQGGSEPAINTISVSVYDLSYYTENYYRMRCLRSFE